jgi:hypothetical protein
MDVYNVIPFSATPFSLDIHELLSETFQTMEKMHPISRNVLPNPSGTWRNVLVYLLYTSLKVFQTISETF